jgi:hypothetical protein
MEKKAQAWGFDITVAIIIFSLGLIVFFIYSINYSNEGAETFENLISEGNFIADNLLSSGIPENWNPEDVRGVGIISSGKINNTKLESFYNLSLADYSKTKRLLNTEHDYFISFNENISLSNRSIAGIGKEEIITNSSNLIRINRFSVYNNKFTNIYVYVGS